MSSNSKTSDADADFSRRVLRWFARHGRKDLPWQKNPTAYRVWVSEIMLQQTQVGAVIPYYRRFMRRFPSLKRLAEAPQDEVLHYWSGLGYYARARNLHKAARLLRNRYHGRFPRDIGQLTALPGIGRSTAGAILALTYGLCHPILDGNVKRVLTRYHAIEGWPEQRHVNQALWKLAEELTPARNTAAYTQAMMDLGATVCRRSSPACGRCPLRTGCRAYRSGRVSEFPYPKPKRSLPERSIRMLVLVDAEGRVLLQKRPPTGIWGGLWSLPECESTQQADGWCRRHGLSIGGMETLPPVRHVFSHFQLLIIPVRIEVSMYRQRIMEAEGFLWYNSDTEHKIGMAAPVQRIVQRVLQQAPA